MKAKTIKSILSKVHSQFVNSITDEEVRKVVDKNSIISGGAITSMLLGEKVNDFDYYFTNKETAIKVAEYYLERFKETHPQYQDYKVWVNDNRIEFSNGSRNVIGDPEIEDPELLEYTELLDRAEDEGKHVDDIREDSSEQKPKYQPTFITSNAISLTGRIQIVLRFYGEPEEIHKNFDFVHATCYWRSENGHLDLPRAALEAILAKELRYVGSLYPICSLFRIRKFINRGWQINAGQIVKMAWQISKLDLSDVDILRDQLVGVDSAYFLQAINYLQKKKDENSDFKVDQFYLFEIIDRIF